TEPFARPVRGATRRAAIAGVRRRSSRYFPRSAAMPKRALSPAPHLSRKPESRADVPRVIPGEATPRGQRPWFADAFAQDALVTGRGGCKAQDQFGRTPFRWAFFDAGRFPARSARFSRGFAS